MQMPCFSINSSVLLRSNALRKTLFRRSICPFNIEWDGPRVTVPIGGTAIDIRRAARAISYARASVSRFQTTVANPHKLWHFVNMTGVITPSPRIPATNQFYSDIIKNMVAIQTSTAATRHLLQGDELSAYCLLPIA